MMLVDKGYYDYDFERTKAVAKPILVEDTMKSEEETRSLLARFGFGIVEPKEESLEELQEMAMKQIAQGDSQVHKKV